jgi:hypothetical protein
MADSSESTKWVTLWKSLRLTTFVDDDRIATQEREKDMMLTFTDYTLLVGYLSVAAFASYASSEVTKAIRTYLDEI